MTRDHSIGLHFAQNEDSGGCIAKLRTRRTTWTTNCEPIESFEWGQVQQGLKG
jgi:hypothetical protein